jgi:hypothetical protein
VMDVNYDAGTGILKETKQVSGDSTVTTFVDCP